MLSMKTIVLTGAGGGIGSSAAKAFLAKGYAVFGLDLKEPADCQGIRFIKTDLTDPVSVQAAYDLCRKECGHVDWLVHAAGIYDLNSLVEMKEEEFLGIFNVNLFGVYRINRTFLPLLQNGSRILILTSELAPLDPLPYTGIYAVTKSALDCYAFSLRMELQLLGIRVIVLRPGAVDTGLLDVSTRRLDAFCRGTSLYKTGADRFRRIVERVEARKIKPEKLAARMIAILSSRHPRYVYSVNRNPLLLLMNALPDRLQCFLIRRLIQEKPSSRSAKI